MRKGRRIKRTWNCFSRLTLSYCHPRMTHHRVKKPSIIIVHVPLLGSNKHKNLGVTPSSKLPCFNFINLTPSPSPLAFPHCTRKHNAINLDLAINEGDTETMLGKLKKIVICTSSTMHKTKEVVREGDMGCGQGNSAETRSIYYIFLNSI